MTHLHWGNLMSQAIILIGKKNMLDQDVVNLAKAIRQQETGNNPVKGASGELASRYQYMPSTWRSVASKYLGTPNAPLTLENENKATYLKIKDWKDAGYNPAQIASMWNSGSPNWEGKVGINKAGVKYDTPSYVKNVYNLYQKNKQETGKNKEYTPSQNQIIAKQYNAPFVSTPGGNIASELAKTAGNIPSSFGNFVKGVVDFLNPYSSGQKLGEAITTGIQAGKEGVSPLDVLKEIPSAAYQTLFPEGARATIEGAGGLAVGALTGNEKLKQASDIRLQEAQRVMTSDPFSQVAPIVLGAEGVKKGTVSKVAEPLIKPIAKTAEVTTGITKKGVEFVGNQITGLNPETRSLAINSPEALSNKNIASISRESLAQKVSNKMESVINAKAETGSGYEAIRTSSEKVVIPQESILDIFNKNKIKITDGKISIDKESIPLSQTDINQLQSFIDTYGIGGEYTGNSFLNARFSLSELSKYGADKTGNLQRISRDLRNSYDQVGKETLSGLKDLDKSYSSLKTEYETIKKDYFQKNKQTGETEFKDGALTKIANATNKGRESVLARLESIVPGISREINILKAIQDIELSNKNKVGTYMRGILPGGVGYLAGGPLGSLLSIILTSPSIVIPLLRLYGEALKIKSNTMDVIIKKLEDGKKLTGVDKEIFYDMLKFASIFNPQQK